MFFKEPIDRTGLSFFSLSLLCKLAALLGDDSCALPSPIENAQLGGAACSQSFARTGAAPLPDSASPVCRSLPQWAWGVEDRLYVPAVGSPFGPGLLPAQVCVASTGCTSLWSAAGGLGAGARPVFIRAFVGARRLQRCATERQSILRSVRESWFLWDPLSHLKMRFCHWCLRAGRHAPSLEGFRTDLERGSGQET